MRLSCSQWSFPKLDAEHALDVIARLGFEQVDVMISPEDIGAHHDYAEVSADVRGTARRLGDQLDARGLALADVFWAPADDYASLAVNNPSPAIRGAAGERFSTMLELTAQLGATGLTTIPGIDFDGESHRDSLARAGEELARRVELAHALGLRLSIEPHFGSVSASPEDTARLCALAPGLELTLDPSHFVGGNHDTDLIAPLVAHARVLHLRAAKPGRLQSKLSENTIEFEPFVDALAANGRDTSITVEYCWAAWQRLDEVDVLSETVLLRDRLRSPVD